MTEADWVGATRPHRMLHILNRLARRSRRPVCSRRLKFFALSCCRLAWPAILDERSRTAVEVAEEHMVGTATDEQLSAAIRDADEAREQAQAARDTLLGSPQGRGDPMARALSMSAGIAAHLVHFVAAEGFYQGLIAQVRDAVAFLELPSGRVRTNQLLVEMCHSLRDIFNNPFRRVAFDPVWRTSTVAELARQMYRSRDFSLMPVLADALQDAGCDNEDVFAHCRSDGPHVPGCWVVDLVLGKD